MKKNIKEMLTVWLAYTVIFGLILVIAMGFISAAYAHEYDVKAMDKFALNEEVKLVKQHIVHTNYVDAIDQAAPCIEISYITIPNKPRVQ